jgi:hypothetical protein
MSELMCDMGEIGVAGANAAGGLDGLLQAEVSGMRCAPQGIEHEHVKMLDERPGRIWNGAAVGEIGKAPDAVSKNHLVPVIDRNGNEGTASKLQGAVQVKERQFREPAATRRRRIEGVRKHASDSLERTLVTVTRDRRALPEIENPHIVEAKDVIGMAVGEEDDVHAGDTERQGLRPKIRGRVHEHRGAIIEADENGGAPPVVAPVGRTTRVALTPDDGDP